MRYERTKGNTSYQHYADVTSALTHPMTNEQNAAYYDESVLNESRSSTWYGDRCGNGNGALNIVDKGWKKGLKRAHDEHIDKIALPTLPNIKRKRIRADRGDSLDIHRVYSGDLSRAWQTTKKHPKATHTGGKVTLFLNYAMVATEESDNLFWRGALAAVLIDHLEKTGRRVQLVCFSATHRHMANDSDQKLVASLVVKAFHQPMSLDKLFSVAAFAGFFRVVGFRMILNQSGRVTATLGTKDATKLPLIAEDDNNGTCVMIDEDVRSRHDMEREMERIFGMFM